MNDLQTALDDAGPAAPQSRPDVELLRRAVEARLDVLVPRDGVSAERVRAAMRYALLGRAKRVRPLLVALTAETFGHRGDAVLDVGCAIEMVHTASLVLDDLPCMDDALLRRGRAAVHREFGQSTAILSAIALLSRAFEIVASVDGAAGGRCAELSGILARAIGLDGLVGGQDGDLRAGPAALASIETVHHGKTGALFVAAIDCGACLAGADRRERHLLSEFGARLGLAFQIQDDLLDATASSSALGKDVGKDKGRSSLVNLLGRDGALAMRRRQVDDMLANLDAVPRQVDLLRSYVAHFCGADVED